MKIAIIHLSDFHIKEKDRFLDYKINQLTNAINTLKNIDSYIIAFSGDLAYSGEKSEYNKSKYLIGKIINNLQTTNNTIKLLMVPGNHDLCLPDNARDGKEIQDYYNTGTINKYLPIEFSYLSNFYENSHVCKIPSRELNGRILYKQYVNDNGFNIQINLINSSPFSTKKPDDKELHYFPTYLADHLRRGQNVDFCITVMHHNWEWFNWEHKYKLENTIIDNSELVLMGHDHVGKTSSLSNNGGIDTCVSSSGKINFSSYESDDSFNVIVINTEKKHLDGYIFNWNVSEKIFVCNKLFENQEFQKHSSHLLPLPSYSKQLRYDSFNQKSNFEQYYVFPKLSVEKSNEYDKSEEINDDKSLLEFISKNKKVCITGASNSGKTTLLKHVYLNITDYSTPLFLSIDSGTKIKTKNLVKHLFEEQYGEDLALYQRYQQLHKSKKSIIIDGIDLLDRKTNKTNLLRLIEDEFGIVIYCTDNLYKEATDKLFEEVSVDHQYVKLHINPFYKEKRCQLVKKIYLLHDASTEDSVIEQINNKIDKLVQNNISLFSLTPDFIIKYTEYYINSPQKDYVQGEAIFSKVFEYEITKSIIDHAKIDDVEEVLLMLEEIAGNMYIQRKDVLTINDINTIIDTYNKDYGADITSRSIVEIGVKTKILKQFDDWSICFYNKNYLAYFIAKYLIRIAQEDKNGTELINNAINNICFGINSDVVLFISFLLNNINIIKYIASQAENLLTSWEEIRFNNTNIDMFGSSHRSVQAPTSEEEKSYSNTNEIAEEANYSEDVVSAKGVFDYNEDEIDDEPNKIIRAFKYTEFLCKALPSFSKNMKIDEKKELIKLIYSYPRRIAFAMVSPIDKDYETICDELYKYCNSSESKEISNRSYTKQDIEEMIMSLCYSTILGLFEHFATICTNSKTIKFLLDKDIVDDSERLERIFIVQNSNDADRFIKEAEIGIGSESSTVVFLTKLIVKRYMFINKTLPHNKRQRIKDIFFTKTIVSKKSLPQKRKYLSSKATEKATE